MANIELFFLVKFECVWRTRNEFTLAQICISIEIKSLNGFCKIYLLVWSFPFGRLSDFWPSSFPQSSGFQRRWFTSVVVVELFAFWIKHKCTHKCCDCFRLFNLNIWFENWIRGLWTHQFHSSAFKTYNVKAIIIIVEKHLNVIRSNAKCWIDFWKWF